MESNYDIQGIMKLLAHRYPFLLIDRVLEVVPGDQITALKNVTINEPFAVSRTPESRSTMGPSRRVRGKVHVAPSSRERIISMVSAARSSFWSIAI